MLGTVSVVPRSLWQAAGGRAAARLCTMLAATALGFGCLPRTDTPAQADTRPRPSYVDMFFQKVPVDPPADVNSREGQQYMQFLATVGREDLHASIEGWRDVARQCEPSPRSTDNVLDSIADRARDARVLIINEAHDRPRHRAFIEQVANRIRQLGYTVYSAETFGEQIRDSAEVPYPRYFDGTYSMEPVFGQLIRTVKSLGFKLAHHEHRLDESENALDQRGRVAAREEGQARNLVRILSGMSEDERLLVHVGYSHAAEVPIMSFGSEPLAWMAARLKEKTGIDPLTVDQTGCWSNTDTIALADPASRFASGQFDLVVAHPRPDFDEHRPTWRLGSGTTKVEIPARLPSSESRVMVEARHEGEPLEAVPADRLLLWPGESIPLVLPAGSFNVVAYFESGGEPVTAYIVVDG